MSRLIPAMIAAAFIAAPALALPQVGVPAPGFTLTDSNGRTVRLRDFRGRTVVLDWNNPGYDAKTTPEPFAINAKGAIAYMGGIDDKPSANVDDIAGARNHVLAALAEMKAGRPVSVARTRSYGCSVKYAG